MLMVLVAVVSMVLVLVVLEVAVLVSAQGPDCATELKQCRLFSVLSGGCQKEQLDFFIFKLRGEEEEEENPWSPEAAAAAGAWPPPPRSGCFPGAGTAAW